MDDSCFVVDSRRSGFYRVVNSCCVDSLWLKSYTRRREENMERKREKDRSEEDGVIEPRWLPRVKASFYLFTYTCIRKYVYVCVQTNEHLQGAYARLIFPCHVRTLAESQTLFRPHKIGEITHARGRCFRSTLRQLILSPPFSSPAVYVGKKAVADGIWQAREYGAPISLRPLGRRNTANDLE